MKFYTIQKRSVWNAWKRKGVIEASSHKDCPFKNEYQWMKSQMYSKLQGYKGEELVWLWLEKPEYYKSWSHIARKKFVLIELELNKNDVVMSDFDLWNHYLNSFDDEAEEDLIKVFDLEWSKNCFLEDDEIQVVQATVGKLSIDRVTKVKSFTTKPSKW